MTTRRFFRRLATLAVVGVIVLVSGLMETVEALPSSASVRYGPRIQSGHIVDGTIVTADIAPSVIQTATGTVSSAELLALMATPIELVAAGGANTVIEFVSATLFYDYGGTAYTVDAGGDDMAIRYTDGSGAIVSRTVDTAGFIDQTNDETCVSVQPLATDVVGASNAALVVDNIGASEWTLGDGVMRYAVTYRVHADGY